MRGGIAHTAQLLLCAAAMRSTIDLDRRTGAAYVGDSCWTSTPGRGVCNALAGHGHVDHLLGRRTDIALEVERDRYWSPTFARQRDLRVSDLHRDVQRVRRQRRC